MYEYEVVLCRKPGDKATVGANWFEITLPMKIEVGEEIDLLLEEGVLANNADKEWATGVVHWMVDGVKHRVKCSFAGKIVAQHQRTSLFLSPSKK